MGNLKKLPNVIGKVTKFNHKLYEKYDIPARDKIKSILGNYVYEHPNELSQDMIINSDNCKYRYLELQVCATWINKDYPYSTVFLYARKLKYNSDTLFLTLNKKLKYGYLFDTTGVDRTKPRRLKKYSREFVYDIPWEDVVYVSIDDMDTLCFELL